MLPAFAPEQLEHGAAVKQQKEESPTPRVRRQKGARLSKSGCKMLFGKVCLENAEGVLYPNLAVALHYFQLNLFPQFIF